jgi:hypothetical protein
MIHAQTNNVPPAKVSFEDFKQLVLEVEDHRKQRLIDLDTFLKMSKQKGVVILDTRSDFRYNRKHVKGAIHLDFTDFTQSNLAKLIPDTETTILIYCNNNFDGDEIDFATKRATPRLQSQRQFALKPIMLALNIPTYINLFGYGYQNVFELSELVNVNDKRIEFEGTVVKKMNR